MLSLSVHCFLTGQCKGIQLWSQVSPAWNNVKLFWTVHCTVVCPTSDHPPYPDNPSPSAYILFSAKQVIALFRAAEPPRQEYVLVLAPSYHKANNCLDNESKHAASHITYTMPSGFNAHFSGVPAYLLSICRSLLVPTVFSFAFVLGIVAFLLILAASWGFLVLKGFVCIVSLLLYVVSSIWCLNILICNHKGRNFSCIHPLHGDDGWFLVAEGQLLCHSLRHSGSS